MKCKITCISDDDDEEINDKDLISFNDISGCQCTMLKKDGKGLVNKDGKDFNW